MTTAPEAGRGGLILALGILSLILCQILGPVVWAMGSGDLKKIDQGLINRDERGLTQAGMICGIIATVFLAIQVLVGLAFIFSQIFLV